MEKRDGRMGADSPVPVLLITGPSGVGKTVVATEASELLDRARVAHALVDIDSLRWCYPRPPHDRFRVGLAMRNLAAVWANFRAAGATRLVLADVLESRDHLERYRAAIPGADIVVVRSFRSNPCSAPNTGRSRQTYSGKGELNALQDGLAGPTQGRGN